jgi:hypothetical protein
MTDAELAHEKQLAHERSLASATTGTGGESSSNAAIAPIAWLSVGLPLAYGIWVTLQKSAVLFK